MAVFELKHPLIEHKLSNLRNKRVLPPDNLHDSSSKKTRQARKVTK